MTAASKGFWFQLERRGDHLCDMSKLVRTSTTVASLALASLGACAPFQPLSSQHALDRTEARIAMDEIRALNQAATASMSMRLKAICAPDPELSRYPKDALTAVLECREAEAADVRQRRAAELELLTSRWPRLEAKAKHYQLGVTPAEIPVIEQEMREVDGETVALIAELSRRVLDDL